MTAARPAGLRLDLERHRRVDLVVEHRLEDLVAGVAVRVADRDRLVDLVAPAVLLARRRADPAQHARERDRALEDPGALAPVRLGVGLQEARDVDVAGALVLARRQAVRVVVAEDQLEVRPAEAADVVGLGLHDHVRLGGPGAADRRVLLALDVDDAHPAGPEAGQLGLVAERRDLDPVVAADLEDRLALEALDDPAVDLDPDARRRLRPLRRLRRQEALAEGVGEGLELHGLGAFRAGDQVGHLSSVGLARGPGRNGDGAADAGWAGAAEDVLVELAPEVSHSGCVRKRRQALVVAQAEATTSADRSASSWRSVGLGRPVAIRSPISLIRRVPIRHGIVLPHASSAQNRVRSRARSTTQARSSAATIDPDPTWAPAARSASNS
jgi:hypothetical protein